MQIFDLKSLVVFISRHSQVMATEAMHSHKFLVEDPSKKHFSFHRAISFTEKDIFLSFRILHFLNFS